jgi:hypothetical protein
MHLTASRFAPLAAFLVGLFGLLVLARPAYAWDPEADRLVARLAYARLDPAAKTKVDALLNGFAVGDTACGTNRLEGAPDVVACLKGRKGDFMRGVVYDPLPICGPPPERSPCADGRCASTVLKQAIATLKAPTAPADAQALALVQTAYLISELHQPLHAADNGDRSGDRTRVLLPGSKRPVSLYGVWDDDLVADAIGSADTGLPYAVALAATHPTWAKGDVKDWLAETHQLAISVTYGRLPQPPPCGRPPPQPEVLTHDYFAVAAPLVREQLTKAAMRLAAVLNAAFG